MNLFSVISSLLLFILIVVLNKFTSGFQIDRIQQSDDRVMSGDISTFDHSKKSAAEFEMDQYLNVIPEYGVKEG